MLSIINLIRISLQLCILISDKYVCYNISNILQRVLLMKNLFTLVILILISNYSWSNVLDRLYLSGSIGSAMQQTNHTQFIQNFAKSGSLVVREVGMGYHLNQNINIELLASRLAIKFSGRYDPDIVRLMEKGGVNRNLSSLIAVEQRVIRLSDQLPSHILDEAKKQIILLETSRNLIKQLSKLSVFSYDEEGVPKLPDLKYDLAIAQAEQINISAEQLKQSEQEYKQRCLDNIDRAQKFLIELKDVFDIKIKINLIAQVRVLYDLYSTDQLLLYSGASLGLVDFVFITKLRKNHQIRPAVALIIGGMYRLSSKLKLGFEYSYLYSSCDFKKQSLFLNPQYTTDDPDQLREPFSKISSSWHWHANPRLDYYPFEQRIVYPVINKRVHNNQLILRVVYKL